MSRDFNQNVLKDPFFLFLFSTKSRIRLSNWTFSTKPLKITSNLYVAKSNGQLSDLKHWPPFNSEGAPESLSSHGFQDTASPHCSPLSLASPSQSPLRAPPHLPGSSLFCPRALSLYLLSFYTYCLGVSCGLTGLKAINALMTHKCVTLCQTSPLTLESNIQSPDLLVSTWSLCLRLGIQIRVLNFQTPLKVLPISANVTSFFFLTV